MICQERLNLLLIISNQNSTIEVLRLRESDWKEYAKQLEQKLLNNQPIHPGNVLLEIMEELHITPCALENRSGIPEEIIKQIIDGNRCITPGIALKLEESLGVPSLLWNSLTRLYKVK